MIVAPLIESLEEDISGLVERSDKVTKEEIINFLDDELPVKFHKAILAGEYYNAEAKSVCGKIRTSIDRLQELWVSNPQSISAKTIADFIRISKSAIAYIDPFIELASNVIENLTLLQRGDHGKRFDYRVFQSYRLLKEVIVMIDLEEKKQKGALKIAVYHINLVLAYTDEHLECRNDIISTLEGIVRHLERGKEKDNNTPFKITAIADLLKAKAEFLLYKIAFRNYLSTKNDEIQDAKPPVFENTNSPYYRFVKMVEYHYSNLKFSDHINEGVIANKIIGDIGGQEMLVGCFHHINKSLGKLGGEGELSLSERKKCIDDWKEKLHEKWSLIDNQYDQIAFKSIYNLFCNTAIKLNLELVKEDDFNSVIKSLQSEFLSDENKKNYASLQKIIEENYGYVLSNHLPNYYDHMLLAKFLNKFIDHLISNPSKLINKALGNLSESIVHERINRLKDNLFERYIWIHNNLMTEVEKMLTHQSKPVFLCIRECMISYDGVVEKTSLFLDSSYILPINFEEVKKDATVAKDFLIPKLQHLKDALEIEYNQIIIKKSQAQLESSILEFEKKVKENEFKVVQIVAMFVSIATFVLINVKIFDNKTGLESFGIIVGLAACFFAFNLLFYLIILAQYDSVKEKNTTQYRKYVSWFIATPIVLALFSLGILLFEGKKKGADIEKINEKLDSNSRSVQKILDNPLFYSVKDTIIIKDTTK